MVGDVKAWVEVEDDWCKACGLCIEACKPGILQLSEGFNLRGYHWVVLVEPEKCSGCMVCALICPEAAIEVYRARKTGS